MAKPYTGKQRGSQLTREMSAGERVTAMDTDSQDGGGRGILLRDEYLARCNEK